MLRSAVRPTLWPVWLFIVMLNVALWATSGDLDTTFATGGKYLAAFYGTSMFGPSVAVRPDGRIIVAGKNFNGADDDFATLRLNAAGTLEGTIITAFSSGKDEDAKSVVLLDDRQY